MKKLTKVQKRAAEIETKQFQFCEKKMFFFQQKLEFIPKSIKMTTLLYLDI